MVDRKIGATERLQDVRSECRILLSSYFCQPFSCLQLIIRGRSVCGARGVQFTSSVRHGVDFYRRYRSPLIPVRSDSLNFYHAAFIRDDWRDSRANV